DAVFRINSERPTQTQIPPSSSFTFRTRRFSLAVASGSTSAIMSYDDVEIEDMDWNEELQAFTYPCPCGDLFQITKEDLKLGEEIARCPSCSLYITVIYNMEDFLDDSNQKNNKGLEPSKQHPIVVA
uniref:Diphthamide biosynthesis protein 3 n=3 Tax=Cucumis melo TaxID=3656 RepID=A0A9I9DHJ0_CUCME